MKRFVQVFLLGVVVAVLVLPSASIAGRRIIEVDNVEELYAAVNDPDNMNKVVKLQSGTYALAANDPDDLPYPNGGRLVLQPGMSIMGDNEYKDWDGDRVWDPYDCSDPTPESIFVVPGTETIIDGIGILDAEGDLIVVGYNNRVSRLTIKNMPYSGALIGSSAAADPDNGADRKFQVIDCLLENDPGIGIAKIGVDCANSGSELNGAKISCTLKGNIARNLPNVGSTPDGFKIRNDEVDNAEIRAFLRYNRAYNIPGVVGATGHGLAVYGTDFFGGNDCKIKAVSIGNVYASCGVGTVVFGAQPLGPPFVPLPFTVSASGSKVHLTSICDRNLNNYTQGGVIIAGAFGLGGDAYENEAAVAMFKTVFISDDGQPENSDSSGIRQDLVALGASRLPVPGVEGILEDNKASLLLLGATSDNGDPSFFIINDDPENEMNLIGSEEMVEKWNHGVDLLIVD